MIKKKGVLAHSVVISLVVAIVLFYPASISREEFPLYRVVLDPGHGGLCLKPANLHGDRFDSISNTYLDLFREGASYRTLEERDIVYSISEKVRSILALCAPGGDYKRFQDILKKYTDNIPCRVYIEAISSRGPSVSSEDAAVQADPNGPYRLFDYPAPGRMERGRLSRINRFRPHLVVSIHLAGKAPREYQGMSPVIVPPYSFLYRGLRYLRGQETSLDYFRDRPYRNWFCEDLEHGPVFWYFNDLSLYFAGYPLDDYKRVKINGFKGYRHNMIDWVYRDGPGWENFARYHVKNTRYSMDYRDVFLNGRFWERERSIYENFRRSGGEEGYGGDNCYASCELIRFMLLGLKHGGFSHPEVKMAKPYVSTWILPIHVNAINAFFELGYLTRARDRFFLTHKQDELAEGLAVGIYSLFTGLDLSGGGSDGMPRGKSIDLEKYIISEDESYFDIVCQGD